MLAAKDLTLNNLNVCRFIVRVLIMNGNTIDWRVQF